MDFYHTRPGNEVGLFYSSRAHTGQPGMQCYPIHCVCTRWNTLHYSPIQQYCMQCVCRRKTRLVLRHCQPTPWKHTDMRDQTLSHSTNCDTSVSYRHHRFVGISYWGWICWGYGLCPSGVQGQSPCQGSGSKPTETENFPFTTFLHFFADIGQTEHSEICMQ